MSKFIWVCNVCGHEAHGYFGQCPNCASWGSLEKEAVSKSKSKSPALKHSLFVSSEDEIKKLSEIEESDIKRLNTGSEEFDRVLGGGIVPASVNLIGGQPGIGKSTLLLQLAFYFAAKNLKTLYVSAEESSSQLKMRALRLRSVEEDERVAERILVYTESNLEKIIEAIKKSQADLVIVDSIQAIYNPNLDSIPGNITQIKECCSNLNKIAKTLALPLFIVGHINKDGDIAGPKLLEHMVDTVLQFELLKDGSLRLLRSIKNRFGSTDELAVFEMKESGLEDVKDPSQIFLNERAAGVVTAIKEGRRPLLCEVQALVIHSEQHNPRRVANGIDFTRLHQILAIMEKYLKLPLSKQDVYVSVAGGLSIKEPASDLAIALSILEKKDNLAALYDLIALGEIGLAGEIRQISNLEIRLKESQKLGFKYAITPVLNTEMRLQLSNLKIQILEAQNIQQAVKIFQKLLGH